MLDDRTPDAQTADFYTRAEALRERQGALGEDPGRHDRSTWDTL